MRRTVTLLLCLFVPVRISFVFLNVLGHNVSSKAKIGFSLVWGTKLYMDERARIGHMNFVNIRLLKMGKRAYIHRLNFLKGPFDIDLANNAAIGTNCVVTRAGSGVSYDFSVLKLGHLSKLTANHKVDLMRSVIMGDFSTVAGSGTQIWTHGYLHEDKGPGRFRIDGEVKIGHNVYIGSRCMINAGVTIADAIVVGSNGCVSKSLLKKGMYVSQPLRYLQKDYNQAKANLEKVEVYDLLEEVYTKSEK